MLALTNIVDVDPSEGSAFGRPGVASPVLAAGVMSEPPEQRGDVAFIHRRGARERHRLVDEDASTQMPDQQDEIVPPKILDDPSRRGARWAPRSPY